ncbi:MAG: RNA 2',3'-cyclic phosphodiesterase [Acidobacteriota bacterium]|nr:RNA 2',3'-cyclic phosphodiesterase [Acidobacteriota bacterium]
MRLFTGIEIPPAILANIDRLLQRLKPSARIQWSPIANLHITTKFIGEWPEERLPELIDTIGVIEAARPIQIGVRDLGFFPSAKSPRVFWAGVHAPAALPALARQTDRALTAMGIASEKRAYSPHLTLARIKIPAPLAALHDAIDALESADFGTFEAAAFHLYRSKTAPTGSVYTKLATFELRRFVY